MRLIAVRHMNQTITLGKIFTLPDAKATELIKAGYVQPFCFWLDKTVPASECAHICSESKIGLQGIERECRHFAAHWQAEMRA